MVSGCLAALSCGTWTTSVVSWTSAISLLPNWSSFLLTETHGKVPVPTAWQYTMCLQIKQLRIDVPAGTIQPTHQLLVRDAHRAAESVPPSSVCAAIYGVMPHVHISNTPSSTNVIVELDGLLQASKASCCIPQWIFSLIKIPSTIRKSHKQTFGPIRYFNSFNKMLIFNGKPIGTTALFLTFSLHFC